MPNPFDTRKQQVLCAVQSVAGTMETLTAAHGKPRVVFGGVPDYQAPREKRNISRAARTPYGSLPSTKALAMGIRTEINTPDTITDSFETDALIQGCGHSITQYRRIPIGAITGGPVARGATVTGAVSGATARLLRPAVTGDAYLYILILTGTFQAEALTMTGGASATSSAVAALWGRLIAPTNTAVVVSAEFQEDGYAWSMRDAAGTMSMEFENSKAGYINFAMQGVKNAIGKKAMTTGIAFDTEDPPIFQNSVAKIGSLWLPVMSKLSFEEGAKVVARGNSNAPNNTGLEGFRITGSRDSKFKITCENVDEDTFDLIAAHEGSTKYPFQFRHGTEDGKSFWGFADQGEITVNGYPDADGIRQVEIEIAPTHTIDNREYEFLSA